MMQDPDGTYLGVFADVRDMADELRHLLMLVFWAAQARGENDGPFAMAAQIALSIVDQQVVCLSEAGSPRTEVAHET